MDARQQCSVVEKPRVDAAASVVRKPPTGGAASVVLAAFFAVAVGVAVFGALVPLDGTSTVGMGFEPPSAEIGRAHV